MNVSISISLNDFVWVKLTHTGLNWYQQRHEELRQVVEENGGTLIDSEKLEVGKWASFQLHGLMEVFGPGIFKGEDLFQNCEIRLTEPKD